MSDLSLQLNPLKPRYNSPSYIKNECGKNKHQTDPELQAMFKRKNFRQSNEIDHAYMSKYFNRLLNLNTD